MIKPDKSKKLSDFYNYLVLLFPISLIFSNLISELILGILIFSFLMKNSSISKLKSYINFFVKLFFIFFFILIISSLLSENIALSIKKSISYLRFILFSFAICWILDNQKKLLINLLKTFILIIFFLQLGGLFELITYNSLNFEGTNKYFERQKISSFFGDEEILGSYLSRLFPIILILLISNLSKFNKKFKIFTFFVLFFTIVTVYFSGERLSFFFILIIALSSIFLIRINFKNISILFSMFLFFIFITLFFEEQRKRIFDYTLSQMKSENKIIFYSSDHHAHFTTAYNIFLDNKILGAGPNTFRKNCNLDKYKSSELACSTHPHNYFIQLLSETGIVGAIIPTFSFLYFLYLFTYLNIFKKNKPKYINDKVILSYFLIFFIICLMPLTPNGNFFNNWTNMIMFFGFGIYLHCFKSDKFNLNKLV